MKRYLLFEFNQYYPEGGMNDFNSEYDSKKELIIGIKSLPAYSERLQVFDSVERRIIYRAETRGFLKRYAQR
jgi:hypothetical protein